MTTRGPSFTPGREGGLEHQSAPPRELAHRVDAAVFAFKGKIREDVKAALVEAAAKGAALKTETAISLEFGGGALHGAVSPRTKGEWWLIANPWLRRIVVDENASEEWRLSVTVSGLLLLNEGYETAKSEARAVARACLESVLGERLRRIDLCADFVGWELGDVERRAFVHHRRLHAADIDVMYRKEYSRAGKRTGFMFGTGNVCRVYDKTEHLHQGLDEAKKADEFAEWRRAGWDGVADVTRVEFQLQGRMLEELGIRDDLDKAGRSLDAVWSYCAHKWIRLVQTGTERGQYNLARPKEGTRKERCYNDVRWQAVQDVTFSAKVAPATRKRVDPTPHARRLVSACVNYNASTGRYPIRKGLDARKLTAEWTEARAEAWIFDVLTKAASVTIRAAVIDLVERFSGPKDAAAHLIEKMNAASTKYAPIRFGDLEPEAAHAA